MDDFEKYRYSEVHKAFSRLNIHTPTEEDEHRWLYRVAYKVAFEFPEARIYEYGTMNGSTAITMGMAIKYAKGIAGRSGQTLDAQLVSVDNYHDHWHRDDPKYVNADTVRKNIIACGLQDCVEIVEMDSLEHIKTLKDGTVSMAWEDSLHTYDHVKETLELVISKMDRNSMLCGHDYIYDCYGVIYAVEEFRKEYEEQLCGFSVHDKIWWTIVKEPIQ